MRGFHNRRMNYFVGSTSSISASSDDRTFAVSDRCAPAVNDDRTRAVRATVGAVLFREILKPLAAGLGPVGKTAIDSVADDLFVKRRP